MIGRFIEDAYIAGRFVWFYTQAPKKMGHVGFTAGPDPTVKERARWAWAKTLGKI